MISYILESALFYWILVSLVFPPFFSTLQKVQSKKVSNLVSCALKTITLSLYEKFNIILVQNNVLYYCISITDFATLVPVQDHNIIHPSRVHF